MYVKQVMEFNSVKMINVLLSQILIMGDNSHKIRNYLYHGLEQINREIICCLIQKGYLDLHNIQLEVFIKKQNNW